MGKRTEKNLLKTAVKTASRQATPAGSPYISDDNDCSSVASDISEATYLSLESDDEFEPGQSKNEATPEEEIKAVMELLLESRTK